MTSCKSTKKSEADKVEKTSVKTEEPKKDTDFKSLDFVYFFKEFKKAVNSRDKVLFEKLTDNQLNIPFDEIFNITITKQILEKFI